MSRMSRNFARSGGGARCYFEEFRAVRAGTPFARETGMKNSPPPPKQPTAQTKGAWVRCLPTMEEQEKKMGLRCQFPSGFSRRWPSLLAPGRWLGHLCYEVSCDTQGL